MSADDDAFTRNLTSLDALGITPVTMGQGIVAVASATVTNRVVPKAIAGGVSLRFVAWQGQ